MVKQEQNVTDTIWLRRQNFHVMPLNLRLGAHTPELECAIRRGIPAHQDLHRNDFYLLELKSGWVYIHVRENAKTVYLVAHSPSTRSHMSPARIGPANDRKGATSTMPEDKSRPADVHGTRFNWLSRLSRVMRMETWQAEFLGIVLSQAFHNEPSVTYVLPDKPARIAVLPRFFSSVVIGTSQLCGEIYTTPDLDGGALWITPEHASTFGRALKKAMLALPFKLDRSSFNRWVNLSAQVQWVHRRLAAGPHWYLMALGVEPSARERVVAEALIEPGLARADSDRLPCYLETFQEQHLSFYKEHGFRIAGVGRIAGSGPDFWSLIRAPRQMTATL